MGFGYRLYPSYAGYAGWCRCWVKAWSPQQIAGRLPLEFPDDELMRDLARGPSPRPSLYKDVERWAGELTACLRTG
jgi:hypothetical protein